MTFRYTCLIILITSSLKTKGQDYFRQLTFGASAGATQALAGATVHKHSVAFGGSIAYYPTPYINFILEAQGGKLVGSPALATLYKNKKTFVNNYLSYTVGANISLGSFYDNPEDGAHKYISPFYFGGGIGLVNNSVVRLDEITLQSVNVPDHMNLVVPVRFGYEFTAATRDEIPVLKVDLSYNFNITGRGVDGYYNQSALAIYFYTYASVGLKYAIRVGPPRQRQNIGD
jgi:hypothetical protein